MYCERLDAARVDPLETTLVECVAKVQLVEAQLAYVMTNSNIC